MGGGKSKVGGGGGAAKAPTPKATTPSGMNKTDFDKMSSAEKINFVNRVYRDPNIRVPAYVDDSAVSKIMYSLGMDQRPDVVDDATFNQMKANGAFQFNNDIFRTVYGNSSAGISATDVAKSNLRDDYTQMSGSGGSAHGKAIYFAGGQNGLAESMDYGRTGSVTMRANVKKNAKILNESTVTGSSEYNAFRNAGHSSKEATALAALALGADGWRQNYSGYNYTMIINRGALAASSTVKKTPRSYTRSAQWGNISTAKRSQTIV